MKESFFDSNNIEACNGKVKSLIGLQKFNEAKQFISILPEEISCNLFSATLFDSASEYIINAILD